MLKKTPLSISWLMLTLALVVVQPASARGQVAARTGSKSANELLERIKANLTKIGVGKDVTVVLSRNDNYHGSIQSVDDTSFKIYEVDLNCAAGA